MCFAPRAVMPASPQVQSAQAPVPTEAKVGDEKAIKLAKKERDIKESGLEGMKVALNVDPAGTGGTPGGTTRA